MKQMFSISVLHDANIEVNSDIINEWLKKTLAGKIDRYVGTTVERFGGSASVYAIKFRLYIIDKEDILTETMRNYLTNTFESLRIMEITKCQEYTADFAVDPLNLYPLGYDILAV